MKHKTYTIPEPSKLVCISIGIAVLVCVIFGIFFRKDFEIVFTVLIVYMGFIWIGRRFFDVENTFMTAFRWIIFAPAITVWHFRKPIKAMIVIAMTYIIVLLILYFVFIWIPEKIWGFSITVPSIVYILLTAISIIMTTWGDLIITWIVKPFQRAKAFGLSELYYQKKIRYLNLLIYFCSIIVFTLASLANKPLFEVDRLDYALLQSFATYISYDRLVRNYKTVVPDGNKEIDNGL